MSIISINETTKEIISEDYQDSQNYQVIKKYQLYEIQLNQVQSNYLILMEFQT